jgi:hypothetical protein
LTTSGGAGPLVFLFMLGNVALSVAANVVVNALQHLR